MVLDGNRNPNPSLEGEIQVIQNAMNQAGVSVKKIDYINPHASGSVIGDDIEIKAIHHCGLENAHINATKSITGHGLSSAGAVEVIATLLQMKAGRLHPTRNLEKPVSFEHNWVQQESVSHKIEHALNLSYGFSGINTALYLKSEM
jgi:malonyl-ACP decarboxylase